MRTCEKVADRSCKGEREEASFYKGAEDHEEEEPDHSDDGEFDENADAHEKEPNHYYEGELDENADDHEKGPDHNDDGELDRNADDHEKEPYHNDDGELDENADDHEKVSDYDDGGSEGGDSNIDMGPIERSSEGSGGQQRKRNVGGVGRRYQWGVWGRIQEHR